VPKTPHLRATLIAVAAAVALAACSAIDGRETGQQYVDDAAVTTKVKAAIFNDPYLHVLQVNVETFQHVVQLSGFVDSRNSARRAVELARSVEGVRSVTDDLIVR